MTLDRVNAAIKKHLNTENMKFAIVTGSAEAMKTALIEDAESPMTYATPKDEAILEEDKIIASYKLNIPEDGVRIIPVDAIFEGKE